MIKDRSQLGAFLRARRDQLTPSEAGIDPLPGERRVPGLRRAELALAAGVSVDYYSRLEQGRQANISREVLDSLARVLRLDEVEHAHLHDLATPPSSPDEPAADQRADAGLLRVISALDHIPAAVIGRRGIVLARNALFSTLYGHSLEPGTSWSYFLLLDPAARLRIDNWADSARAAVAGLRRQAARHPQDRRLHRLIDDLRRSDPDIERWWDDHRVGEYSSGHRRIRHPVAGDLDFDVELLVAAHEADQHLVVYTVEPHSRTARTLPLLAAWGHDMAARTAADIAPNS